MTSQDRRAAEEIARCYGAERTRCADVIFELIQKARKEECERCAKVADDETECEDGEIYVARMIAKRIRALPESEG